MPDWSRIAEEMAIEDSEVLEEGRLSSFAKGALAAGALALGGMAKADIADGGFGYGSGDGYAYRGGANPTVQQYEELKAHRPFSVHKYRQRHSDTNRQIHDMGLDRGSTGYGKFGWTADDKSSSFASSRLGADGYRSIEDIEKEAGGDKSAVEDALSGDSRIEYQPMEIHAKRSGLLKVRVFSSNGNRTAQLEETTPEGETEARTFNLYLPVGCRGATPMETEANEWLYGGNGLTDSQIHSMFSTAFTALRSKRAEIAPGVEMLVMNTSHDDEVKANLIELDREFTKVCNAFDLGYEGIREMANIPEYSQDGKSQVTLGYNDMKDDGHSGQKMFKTQKYGQFALVMRDSTGAPIPLPVLRATMAHELCHHMRLGHGKDFMYMLRKVLSYCESQGMEIQYDEDDITPYDSHTLERGEDDPYETAGYKFWEQVLPVDDLFRSIV